MHPASEPATWPPQSCEEVRLWLNARLDSECTPAQEGWLVEHLQSCLDCSAEWAALENTRLAFETARLREPSDLERDALARLMAPRFWLGLGWGLVMVGALLLGGYGGWLLWTDASTPAAVRVGLGALAAGLLVLVARYAWERYRLLHLDPYRNVLR